MGISAALGRTIAPQDTSEAEAPNDPLTVVMASILLLTVAALAGYLPARRASRVEPMIALNCE